MSRGGDFIEEESALSPQKDLVMANTPIKILAISKDDIDKGDPTYYQKDLGVDYSISKKLKGLMQNIKENLRSRSPSKK